MAGSGIGDTSGERTAIGDGRRETLAYVRASVKEAAATLKYFACG
jgi:hypothetical protein